AVSLVAQEDGSTLYIGTSDGIGGGSVSKVSLSSNTLAESWNTTTDTALVG
ncbi:unnamed protein product, partial [marine sediment metagenome]